MQFVGIDLSIGSTGVVILQENVDDPVTCQLVVSKKTDIPDYLRFIEIAKKIADLIATSEETYGESKIVIENFAFCATGSLTRLGELRGILAYELHKQLDKHYMLCAPTAVKKYAFGLKCPKGKGVIMKAVLQNWGFDTNYDDMADAYVLAQIARELYNIESDKGVSNLPKYRQEVLQKILKK